MQALVKNLQLGVVNDKWLSQLTLNVLLNPEQQSLDLLNHLHDLLLCAVCQRLASGKGVLDPLDLLDADDHLFLCS